MYLATLRAKLGQWCIQEKHKGDSTKAVEIFTECPWKQVGNYITKHTIISWKFSLQSSALTVPLFRVSSFHLLYLSSPPTSTHLPPPLSLLPFFLLKSSLACSQLLLCSCFKGKDSGQSICKYLHLVFLSFVLISIINI